MQPLRAWWSEQPRNTRLGLGALSGAGVALVAVVVTLVFGGGGGAASAPPVLVVSVSATARPDASANASATATVTVAATGTPEGVLTVRTLAELKGRFGEPPQAKYGRIRIPRIGVDAPIGASYVGSDLALGIPVGPSDAVWYDFSAADPQFGGAPGDGGNAILAGHVDFAAWLPFANASYRGPGVFRSLELLAPGDTITVQVGGRTLEYAVLWRTRESGSGGDWARIMRKQVEGDAITLVTCVGDFNFQTLEYSHRVVVRAIRT